MPINAGYEYFEKEKKYLDATSLEDKIYWLEEMIKAAPKHKSSENFVAELKRRLIKLREKQEKARKKSGGRKGIRKEGFQFVLFGLTGKGKTQLLGALTNVRPVIKGTMFSTKVPEIGTFFYLGVQAQIVDSPSVGSESFDIGLVNNADCLIIVIEDISEINELEKYMQRVSGKKIIVVNKRDIYSEDEKRKIMERMRSRKIQGIFLSALTGENIGELKNEMIEKMDIVRVYLKEPGKPFKDVPLVLKQGSRVKDVAEGIFKGFSRSVRETRITGPSAKFPNQRVGLDHKVKDKDVVEFHTR